MDEEALELLKEQIKAEWAKAAELKRQNDLAEQTLQALNRTRISEQTRIQFWAGISEQTAALVAKLPETELLLLSLAEKLEDFGEILQEQRQEDSRRLARLEYGLMLLLGGKTNGNKERVTEFIKDTQKDRLKVLLSEQYALLHELEMKKVAYSREHSTLDIPGWMTRDIDDVQGEIAKLENDLRVLGS